MSSQNKLTLDFAQRLGLKPVRDTFQVDSMDEELKSLLWSHIHLTFFKSSYQGLFFFVRQDPYGAYQDSIWVYVFKQPVDTRPSTLEAFRYYVREYFLKSAWYDSYNLLEYLGRCVNDASPEEFENFSKEANKLLDRCMSGYRFVGREITPITNEHEIRGIEKALEETSALESVHNHLNEALRILSDRENPNYRNSVKESISAVEAICQIITGDDKATLGKALTRLKSKGVEIHGSMVEGWSRLYGYTSDHGGIRHALSEGQQEVDSATAQYMLVSCSAFVSYLIKISQNAGINLK